MEDDDTLVVQAQEGDRRAFDALFARYQARITSFCARQLNSISEGEEAAQDVLLRAWEKIRSFRFESPFVYWLMSIASHTCHNLRRTKKWREVRHGLSLDAPGILAVVEMQLTESEMAAQVEQRVFANELLNELRRRAVDARPPWDILDWSILYLRYERGIKTLREVARLLQTPEGTVKDRFYKNIKPILQMVRAAVLADDFAVPQDRAQGVSK